MRGVRSALLLATADHYFGLSVSFLSIIAVSRLLTPQEIRLAVIGSAICSLWFRLRRVQDNILLHISQRPEPRGYTRPAFTVSFLFNASLCLVLMASADFVARLYGQDKLALLIRVSAVVYFLEVFAAPIVVLFQRDMALGKVSLINVSNAALMDGSTVAFAVYRDPSPVFGMSTSIVVIGNSRFCCKPAPVFFWRAEFEKDRLEQCDPIQIAWRGRGHCAQPGRVLRLE
jgi:O-antigen/teichoic acid export membrane protein